MKAQATRTPARNATLQERGARTATPQRGLAASGAAPARRQNATAAAASRFESAGTAARESATMRILVVEDEKKVAEFIQRGLREENYAVDIAREGEDGAYLASSFDYDLVVLDLMLPKLAGLEVLQRIRAAKPSLPVLVLTAKTTVEDRVAGLDRGADDYLVKPFAFAELSARVRALLRRGTTEAVELQIADLKMDSASRQVTRRGRRIDLSPKEFALLEFLLRHARRPVTRTMIIEHVWDMNFDSMSNVVDVYINYLRNKIDRGFSPPLIRTLRGVGYMLSDERT
jgi:two-component system copper resistance phosphate regulon response regulator CusR